MARSGRDPSQFARDLLAHLRHLLIAQTTGEVPTTFVVTATDTARMQAQAQAIGPATLIRTIDELADALTAVREGDDARLAVEIALLKAARPDLDPATAGLLRRIERLEQTGRRRSTRGSCRRRGPTAACNCAGGGPAYDATHGRCLGKTTRHRPTSQLQPRKRPSAPDGRAGRAAPPAEAEAIDAAPPAGGDDAEDSRQLARAPYRRQDPPANPPPSLTT